MPESYSDYILSSSRRNKERRANEEKTAARIKGTDEEELNRQINRQAQELRMRGEKPHLNPALSVISRVGDLLSRGNYAAAEYFDASAESEDKKDNEFKSVWEGIKGAGRGLTGHDKTTFHDVLKEHGLPFHRGAGWKEGKPTAALGFALDVGLDPTTYISMGSSAVGKEAAIGVAKGAGKTAAEKAAFEVVSEASKRGTQRAIRKSGKVGADTAAAKAIKETMDQGSKDIGKKISRQMRESLLTGSKPNVKTAKRLSETMLKDEAYEAGLEARRLVNEGTKGAYGLNILGNPVLKSEKLYSVGERINEKWLGTGVGRDVQKLFSTASKFPGPLNLIKRESEGFATGHAEDLFKAIDKDFRSVPKVDKRRIARAIELKQDLKGELGTKGHDLGELQQKALSVRDNITAEQLSDGTLKHMVDPKTGEVVQSDLLDNYLYHYYRSNNRRAVSQFKDERRIAQNAFKNKGKSTKIMTLEDAANKGLKPVQEIDDILKLHAAKYYKEKGRFLYAKAIEDEFGVPLSEEAAKAAGKSVDDLADQIDLVKSTHRYHNGNVAKGESTYLPKKIHESLKAMDGLYDNVDEANRLLRHYDKVLAMWKFGNTAPNPGHHIRNLVGDIHNNWLDGVVNPHRYEQAIEVMRANPKTKIRIGNGTLNAEQIMNYYKDLGVKSGYTRVEIGARKFRPTEKIMEMAETREDFGRMAHFIDSFKKEADGLDLAKDVDGKKLREAASRASGRVREYNVDYGDLTDFEKKVMKRLVPFYTWNRKNMPLQLKALAMHPGRQAIVPKATKMLQEMAGEDPNNPYPTIGGLQTVPKWLRDIDGLQILGEGQGRHGVYFDPSVALPSLGAADVIDQPIAQLLAGHPGGAKDAAAQEFVNQLNPVAKNIVESATGINTFTGGKTQPGFVNDVSAQNPILRLLNKQRQGTADKYDWINWGTGATLRDIGSKETMSEYRRQQDALEPQLKATGGRAALMLAETPIEQYDPRVRDEDDRVRASQRLLNEMDDLQSGGQGLSLVKMQERLQKPNVDARRNRVNLILQSYFGDHPDYQAFTTVVR